MKAKLIGAVSFLAESGLSFLLLLALAPLPAEAGKGSASYYLEAYIYLGRTREPRPQLSVCVGFSNTVSTWQPGLAKGTFVVLDPWLYGSADFSGRVTLTESKLVIERKQPPGGDAIRLSPFIVLRPVVGDRGQGAEGKRIIDIGRGECHEFKRRFSTMSRPDDVESVTWTISRYRPPGDVRPGASATTDRFTLVMKPGTPGLHVTRWWDRKQRREEFHFVNSRWGCKKHGIARYWNKDGTLAKTEYYSKGSRISKDAYEKKLAAEKEAGAK